MTAVDVTSVAFYSTQAGACGVGDLALNPQQSSHAAEHLRGALNLRAQMTLYFIDLPVWDSERNERTHISFPINLPHEQFASSWALDAASWDPINYSVDEWPVGFADNEAG